MPGNIRLNFLNGCQYNVLCENDELTTVVPMFQEFKMSMD